MDSAYEQLEQQLQSENLGHRLTAVNQLRELDPAVAFKLVQLVIQDSSARVRYAAVSLLSSIGHQDEATALRLLREALLNDPEADVQAAAADSIGALHLTTAYDDLARVYEQTSEWLVQMSVIACLGELGEPRAFDLLQSALSSDNGIVVLSAIGALGELGDNRAVELLLPFTDHPDWQTRHRLVQALSQYEDEAARSALEQMTNDDSPIVAEAAQVHLDAA
ncbi:MAG: HEAT repeat domain-containing protein [Leptolyngbya sp. SIO4C1]|nr:HEAT repeat domain-containing protein [Leptolyngbya sp. SIO4C1]